METTPCKALVVFTQFVEGYGMVHGDPDSSLKEAKTPAVPHSHITAWADAGLIAAPKGFKAEADESDAPPA